MTFFLAVIASNENSVIDFTGKLPDEYIHINM